MKRANQAYNDLSLQAWETRTLRRCALHRPAYHDIQARYRDLPAQVVVRCMAKVSDASYTLDQKHQRRFRAEGVIAYDARILSWKDEQ
jgi:hypothetical protein